MTTRQPTLEYYNDDLGEYRWRVRAANGEIISASDEGFVDLRNAMDNYQRSLVPVSEDNTIYPEGSDYAASQHIRLDGQDFSEEEDADTAEGRIGDAGGLGESSENADAGSVDPDSDGA